MKAALQTCALALLLVTGRARAASDPIDTAGPLVAALVEGVLLDGKPDLPAKQRAALDAAMRAADRRYRGAPLSNPSARRYDAMLALAHGFSADALRSPRVAAALVELAGQGDLLARAAGGALVWQASRALGQAQQSSEPPDAVALALARDYVPACPGPFARLAAETGAPDPAALRAALPYCEAGTSTQPLGADRSLAREIVRRVLGAANEARERLGAGKEGLGPWRPAFDKLERVLAAGVQVPYEVASDGTVEGVSPPQAPPVAGLPGGAGAERIVGADGVHQVAGAPHMAVSGGILSVDDGPPARRIARLGDSIGPLLETAPLGRPGALLVVADADATVGALLLPVSGPELPAAPAALALVVRDPTGGFGIVTIERGKGPAELELRVDARRGSVKLRWKGGKRTPVVSLTRLSDLPGAVDKLTGGTAPQGVVLIVPRSVPVHTLALLATSLKARVLLVVEGGR